MKIFFDKAVDELLERTADVVEMQDELDKYAKGMDEMHVEIRNLLDRAESAEDAIAEANMRVNNHRRTADDLHQENLDLRDDRSIYKEALIQLTHRDYSDSVCSIAALALHEVNCNE